MKESGVAAQLKKKLTALGYIVIKNTVVSLRGWPDRTVYRNSRCFFIETKTTGKTPTPIQLHRHNELRAQGFIVLVIDNQEGIANLLKALQYGQKDIPTI